MTTIQKFGSQEKHVQTEQKVIALVDEAHRTQYKFNAQAMRAAMPNAVFFAFSGTPIDKKNRSTYRVFGPLLDKYSTYQTNSSKKYFIFYFTRSTKTLISTIRCYYKSFPVVFNRIRGWMTFLEVMSIKTICFLFFSVFSLGLKILSE